MSNSRLSVLSLLTIRSDILGAGVNNLSAIAGHFTELGLKIAASELR